MRNKAGYLLILENEKRIVEIFVDELAAMTKRPADEILQKGLYAGELFREIVEVSLEDGSTAKFQYAFYIESPEKGVIAVFSEHCGYHLFHHEGTTVRSKSQYT